MQLSYFPHLKIRNLLSVAFWASLFSAFATAFAEEDSNPLEPDIVFIIVDDLNDYLGCLGGHPDAKSPNIDALAASGMLFTQAYCNAPQCRPSRTSLNHGVYPFRTGTYFNARFKQEKRIESPTMQQFFSSHGYRVASGGKVHHGGPGGHGDSLLKRPADPKPPADEDNFDVLNPPNDGYALNVSDEEMGDYKVSEWAIREWRRESDETAFHECRLLSPAPSTASPQSLL